MRKTERYSLCREEKSISSQERKRRKMNSTQNFCRRICGFFSCDQSSNGEEANDSETLQKTPMAPNSLSPLTIQEQEDPFLSPPSLSPSLPPSLSLSGFYASFTPFPPPLLPPPNENRNRTNSLPCQRPSLSYGII